MVFITEKHIMNSLIELLNIANYLDKNGLWKESSEVDKIVESARPKPVYDFSDTFKEKYGPRIIRYLKPHESLKDTHWFEILDDKYLGDQPYDDFELEKRFNKIEEARNNQQNRIAQVGQDSYIDSMKFYSYQLHGLANDCLRYISEHPERAESDLEYLKTKLVEIEQRVIHMKELYEAGAKMQPGSEIHKELYYLYNLTAKAYKSFLGRYYNYVHADLFDKLK